MDCVLGAGPGVARTVHHDDQTFLGVVLTDKKPKVELSADLDHPESLYLAGGFGRRKGVSARAGRLVYSVSAEDEIVKEGTIELAPGELWWERTIDLPSSLLGPVKVHIDAEISADQIVYLRDVLVQQEIAGIHGRSSGPQMILISVDTLREDAVGALGGPWHTPNLDALVAEGERWSSNYSGGGWTRPSHATMLTGYRGDTHRMYEKDRVLSAGLQTLAERLQSAGFATGGFVYDCKWLDPKWGFGRGFDLYEVLNARAERQVHPVVNWVEAHRRDPFFLFFHTFEVHSDFFHLPYESPGTTVAGVSREFGVEDFGCAGDRCASAHLTDVNNGVVQPLPNEAEILRQLYGRGVEETDRALGVLFDELKKLGVWRDALIVVTSDHGEAFLEHGRFLHGLTWNEIVRVPLIIKWPEGRAAGSVGRFTSGSVDLAPTFLMNAGVDRGDLPGVPLQTLDQERPVMIGGPNRMLVSDGWKINAGGNARDIHFLSKLNADPWEERNLAESRAGRAHRMLRAMRQLIRTDRELRRKHHSAEGKKTATMSDEERQKLKALGYLDE